MVFIGYPSFEAKRILKTSSFKQLQPVEDCLHSQRIQTAEDCRESHGLPRYGVHEKRTVPTGPDPLHN
ncbi:hypothetical protein SUGI_0853910 [Cryptomeria japonica]|nr:hypothetical protein SUGI_0853910 [Cryptomeria japonica]